MTLEENLCEIDITLEALAYEYLNATALTRDEWMAEIDKILDERLEFTKGLRTTLVSE